LILASTAKEEEAQANESSDTKNGANGGARDCTT
jgi:hypothetical protein